MKPNLDVNLCDSTPVIIGLSLKLPYHIDDEKTLWQFLIDGNKLHTEADELCLVHGGDDTAYANLLPNWDFFSPSLFNLKLNESAQIDPQQKLALYGVHRCIENAAMTRSDLQQAVTGVYAGVMTVDSLHENARQADASDVDSRFFLNHCEGCIANRVSHCFDFQGESKSINAACASSLIALKDACESIQRGQNDFAFAIGVNHIKSKLRYQSFKKAGMLSRSGWCHSFSIQADGYLAVEGMVTLLLTSKAKAEALNANILAAVVGISSNHNGKTDTMTAPDVGAQSNLILAAQKQCKQLDVAYVEAHGTGTSLGDPIELEAITRHYQQCYVGSIKANLGHMEAASGLLGVAKCLLILEHEQIPPHPLQGKLNTLLPQDMVQVNTQPVDYLQSQIAVSSFGFGGANTHAILQKVPKRMQIKHDAPLKLPILLSAINKDELSEAIVMVERNYLEKDHRCNLALNSIYSLDHPEQYRTAAWISVDSSQLTWLEKQSSSLIIPMNFSVLEEETNRYYVQQNLENDKQLANYWLTFFEDFLPPHFLY